MDETAFAQLLQLFNGNHDGAIPATVGQPQSTPIWWDKGKKKNGTNPVQTIKRPDWATSNPSNIIQLLRQLSANAGQQFMPGGKVGSVRQAPWSPATASSQQPRYQMNPNLSTSAETGGEQTWFTNAMGGGMTPLAAAPFGLGVPLGWNPFATATKQKTK